MRFVDVKNDIAFHKIFGNANQTICLISFLNAVLQLEEGRRVVSVTIENPYLFPTVPTGKTSIIDVRATDQEGRKFIVEMQVADKKGFDKRVQYYAARDYSSQIEKGDDYQLLRPAYFIAILDFVFTQSLSYFSTHQTLDVETGENLLKDIKYYFIELEKFNKTLEELYTMKDKWTYFIKNAENLTLMPENVEDIGLETAYKEADKQTWGKKELNIYDDSKVRERDVIQEKLFVLEKGEEKGKREKEMEMIIAMHKAGISIAQIAAIAQKTAEEILQIMEK